MDDGLSAAQMQCATALSALSDERREVFALRLDRWWPDLVDGLKGVYGAHVTRDIALRLTERAATAYLERDPELHRLDLVPSLEPDWLQQPHMVGYSGYADRFAPSRRAHGWPLQRHRQLAALVGRTGGGART